MNQSLIEVKQGDGPVVLAQPHGGTHVPQDIWKNLNDTGRALADTDWHINRLYDGLLSDATVVQTKVHRYAIDANRDPQDASLYPGQNTTSLCPTTDFDGVPVYKADREPSPEEIEGRTKAYHAPYHEALKQELARVREIHGVAILYDCHSIRSNVPYLFDGQLPVFNIGTNGGETCSAEVQSAVETGCAEAKTRTPDYDFVVNGRFKGGWTTRHYGKPDAGVHAIQMELAQRAYMQEAPPWNYSTEKADRLRSCLATLLNRIHAVAIDLELSDFFKD